MSEQCINIGIMLQVGTMLHGVYRIDRYLSSGGFGNTYVATNVEFEEVVAIKEFFINGVTERDANNTTVIVSNSENKNLFEEQLQKFKKEARRLRKLKNEHIVKVHDLFEENGTAYYVMDYIDGENLSVRLKRLQKPLSEEEVMKYLPQILKALECVHEDKLYHLDLKPANIMVDRQGNVTLIDFGASKQRSSAGGATTSTAVSYTNGFAPREQMEQNLDKFGPWTDLYALGATLYNLLTNKKPPLPSDIDDDRSTDKHLALPMPQSVSEKTKQIILWLMRTDRLDRPQSVTALRSMMVQYDDDSHTFVLPADTQNETPEVIEENTKVMGETPMSNERKGTPINDERPLKSRKWLYVAIAALLIVLSSVVNFFINNYKRHVVEVNAGMANEIQKGNISSQSTLIDNVDDSFQKDEREIIDKLIANMVHVAGGTFTMGATSEQGSDDAYEVEKPTHQVTLSSFSISRYEVTQEEWHAIMGYNPSYFKGDRRPVENVSWNDCQEFIRKLNEMTGKRFRLPTEAEREFAARGGNNSRGYKYAGSNNIDSVAWYTSNSGSETHPVGQKQPNELGLYDMAGNVFEWCSDWYGSYSSSSQTNPTGASSSSFRVYRGGSWGRAAWSSRVSCRSFSSPDYRFNGLGLRLAL